MTTAATSIQQTEENLTLFGIEHLVRLRKANLIAFDCETTGLKPERGGLRLLQLGAERMPVVVIDCWELAPEDWVRLGDFLMERSRFWLAHNAAFDLGWLQEHGLYLKGRIMCLMLASKLLSNGLPNLKHGLAPVLERYTGKQISKELQTSDWSAPVLSRDQLAYAADDIRALLDLNNILQDRLGVARLTRAFSLECKALPAMAQMQRVGLPFNRIKLEQLKAALERDIKTYGTQFIADLDAALPEDHKLPRDEDGSFNLRIKAEGYVRDGTKKLAGFNMNSSKQMIEKLTVLLGQTPVDRNGKPSASREALRSYAADSRVIYMYLQWKRAEKRRQMVTSMLEHLAPDGFIRAGYMQLGAESGRMSCSNPNNQQIPRDNSFRVCAEAPDGWTFVCADFGQMELRLAAALAEDERMIKAFQDGVDLHTLTASAIYPEPTNDEKELKLRRQVSKSANFGLLFGSGAKGLRNYAGASGITMTIEEADAIRDTFHQTYPGISAWQQNNAYESDKTKGNRWAEIRIPLTDMRRYLPGDTNRVTVRCNTPVQGAGAAIMKRALGDLWPLLFEAGEDEAKLSAVVHDEILLLVRDGVEDKWKKVLQDVMEHAEARWLGSIPPLAEANSGKTWADAK
jgi:DNA polymerase-1